MLAAWLGELFWQAKRRLLLVIELEGFFNWFIVVRGGGGSGGVGVGGGNGGVGGGHVGNRCCSKFALGLG